MNEVYSYIYSLAVAASAAGLATALAPDGGQLKKYVKYIASLCVLVMLALPAKNMIAALTDGVGEAMAALGAEYRADEAEYDAEALLLAQAKANVEASLAALLSAKLDCDEESVSVNVTLDASEPSSIKVSRINASAPAERKTVGVEIWFAEQTGCAAGNVVVEWVSSGI